MKLLLWFTLLVVTFIAIQTTVDGGLIRRSRRLRRIGPYRRNGIRAPRVLNKRKWPHFLAPPRKLSWGRNNRRMRNEREERHPIRPGHHLRLPLMMAQPSLVQSSTTQLSSWRPLDFGNPIDRDPTFDYAPPALERVRFAERPEKRRRNNKPPGIMRSQQENNGKSRPQLFQRPRRPSIWKLLATKQRPRRPMAPRRRPPYMRHPEAQNSNDEAEIFPRIPNIYYFRPTDVLPSVSTNPSASVSPARPNTNSRPMLIIPPPPTFKPGKVASVPLYSHEHQSSSQFTPVPMSTTPMSTFIPSKPDDILYREQQYINPTRKPPTILQPAKSTPITVSSTRNSVIKPVEPTQPTDAETESLLDIINDPPKPLNSFTIFNSINSVFTNDAKANKPQINNIRGAPVTEVPIVKPTVAKPTTTTAAPTTTTTTTTTTTKPTTTTTTEAPVIPEILAFGENTEEESSTVSVSTSVSSSTSVLVRTPPPVSKSSSTTETSVSSTSPLPSYQKLPDMPTYKRRQPIYPKRYSSPKTPHAGVSSIVSSSKVSSNVPSSKDSNGSGEGLVITMARSKVKEYKPHLLANYTQLLTFDKVVADGDASDNESGDPIPLPSLTLNTPTNSPVVSSIVSKQNETSTEKSVMEEFDPMQLLHSWFQNT